MTKPIQKVPTRQKVVPGLWTESSWSVRITFRRTAPTFRRLSLSMKAAPSAQQYDRARFNGVVSRVPLASDNRLARKPRGRGEIRRQLGCPLNAWAPLVAFAALPLRCRTSKRLRLQHLFRQPNSSI